MTRPEARAYPVLSPDRWLLLHGGALGDLVLSIQLAVSIKAVRDAGELRALSRTDPGDLSGLTPSVRRESLESFSSQWLYVDTDAEPEPRLRDAIAGRCIVNALGDADSIVHKQLDKLAPAGLFSFDPRPREELASHITGQWKDDLAPQGVGFCEGDPPVRALSASDGFLRGADGPAPPDRSLALAARTSDRSRLAGDCPASPRDACSDPQVVIHPGSGGANKCWPLPCFLNVARRLHEFSVAATFLIGPAEAERWAKHDLDAIANEFRLIDSPSPNELCTLLRDARVFLGNDAGPTHLAALLAVATIAVFGPTNAAVWRPLGPSVEVFQGNPSASSTNWSVPPQHITTAVTDFLYEP